ncbi:MAG TPA: DEAD/DEAH box helicase, partial [Chromatiales bacterium]|nr:DEAD/DEAH box helicase [Chromatiales bacterium]
MAAPGPSPTPAAVDPAARPVTALRGVGPQLARRLERIGVRTVADLLLHRPLRYEDRTRLVPLGALRPGARALVEATVELAEVRPHPRRQLLVRVSDGTGALTLRFFHFSEAQRRLFRRGARMRLWGEARAGPAGLEMVHPEVRVLRGAEPLEAALTPVYPATEGLHQAVLRRLAGEALALLDRGAFPELLPERLLQGLGLPPLHEALRLVHRPPAGADAEALAAGTHPAVRRLALEELLAHALSLRRLRAKVRTAAAPALEDGTLAERLLETLPFAPTGAQRRVIAEVAADLARPRPMLRLVQGDVGSGKTVVAAAALCRAVGSGWQGALMAPTELLAEQHARSLTTWLEPLGVRVVLLTGGRRRGR